MVVIADATAVAAAATAAATTERSASLFRSNHRFLLALYFLCFPINSMVNTGIQR